MRKTYHTLLKHHFHSTLVRTRANLGITQSEMAERLAMDDRSFIDLDHGKTCCSAITLVLFLIYVCEDVDGFLEELQRVFEAGTDQVA